jgi:hypothetical protein
VGVEATFYSSSSSSAFASFRSRVAKPSVNGTGGGLLVLRDEIAPFLGVELLRERRRPDEIAEEHRQLAALAGAHNVGVG